MLNDHRKKVNRMYTEVSVNVMMNLFSAITLVSCTSQDEGMPVTSEVR